MEELMILLAAISFLLLCLMAEKHWISDIIGQSFVGFSFGVLFIESLRRTFCYSIRSTYRKIPTAFTPFLTFIFHAIALSMMSTVYWKYMLIATVLGIFWWGLSVIGEGCQVIVDGMNEKVAEISHNGG